MQLDKSQQLYLQIIKDLHNYWKPHSGQQKVGMDLINGKINTLFIQCGRKWGKTDFAVYLLWRHALLNPGSTCYYITPELSHGKEIVWNNNRLQSFAREVDEKGRITPGGENPLGKYIKSINNTDTRIVLHNKSQIKIVGSENWAAANGLTPDFVVYDEFKIFHPTFHNEMNPNRIVRSAPLVIIGTPPKPGDRNMDQYNEFADECKTRDDAVHYEASSYDNPYTPAKEIDREIEKLRARGDEDVVQREYYGKTVRGGAAAIFPMLEPTHVVPHEKIMREISRDLKKLEWFCVADPGTTTCFGVLFGAIHPYSRKVYILDEIYEKDQANTSVRRIFPRMERTCKSLFPYGDIDDEWICVYDEAAAWFCNEVLNQFGTYFQPTNKIGNKKEHGLSLLKDLLIHDMIVISDNCKNLYWEMENYAKDDKGKIPKKNDHLIDTLRYLLDAAGYHMVEIEEIIDKIPEDRKRRGYTLEEDMKKWEKENKWDIGFNKFIKGE